MRFLMGFRASKIKKLGKPVEKKTTNTASAPSASASKKTKSIPPAPVVKNPTPSPNLNLSKEEVELLLFCIKHSTFQGTSIELVYNLVSKLQKQLPKVKK